ncbi:putative lipoprotein, partial [Vibrio parahaemolyticus EKP-026]
MITFGNRPTFAIISLTRSFTSCLD